MTLAYEAVLTKFTAPANVSYNHRLVFISTVVSVAWLHAIVNQIRQHYLRCTLQFSLLSLVVHSQRTVICYKEERKFIGSIDVVFIADLVLFSLHVLHRQRIHFLRIGCLLLCIIRTTNF